MRKDFLLTLLFLYKQEIRSHEEREDRIEI